MIKEHDENSGDIDRNMCVAGWLACWDIENDSKFHILIAMFQNYFRVLLYLD